MATRPAKCCKACDYSAPHVFALIFRFSGSQNLSKPLHMPLIRPSSDDDLPAITAIYGHHVLHGTGSFETEPPSLADMTARRADVLAKGLPYLVVEQDGKIAGFAYGNWFKPRPAYRYSVEDSIYMAPDLQRRGLGRALLAELLAQFEAVGIRKVMAIVGDSANTGSVGIHLAFGFKQVGVVESCGWKFGAWRDIVIMQKAIGPGDTQPPQIVTA
jgi:L-amino acid N-acyltransferase YncA